MTSIKPRPTLSLAQPPQEQPRTEPIKVERLQGESDAHYAKRCASIHALGINWQRHPSYPAPSRHSDQESIWQKARQDFLDGISKAAAVDRQRNPAFRRAEELRAVTERAM